MMVTEFYNRLLKSFVEDKVFFAWNDYKIPDLDKVDADYKIINKFYLDYPGVQLYYPYAKEYVAFLYALFGVGHMQEILSKIEQMEVELKKKDVKPIAIENSMGVEEWYYKYQDVKRVTDTLIINAIRLHLLIDTIVASCTVAKIPLGSDVSNNLIGVCLKCGKIYEIIDGIPQKKCNCEKLEGVPEQ